MGDKEDQRLAQHVLSLATLYLGRRNFTTALHLLQLSLHYHENNSRARYLLGRLLLQQGDTEGALRELQQAKELDPFFEDVYRQLGLILLDKGEAADALESFMDGYVLSGGSILASNSFYQQHIGNCLTILRSRSQKEHYDKLFIQRKEHFENLANDLVSRSSREGMGSIRADQVLFHDVHASELSTATLEMVMRALKKFDLMKALVENELHSIAAITEPKTTDMGEVIFREGDPMDAIYLVDQGSVRIVKNTPFGEQILTSLSSGEFIGDVDFIENAPCSADAICNSRSTLLSISKTSLEELFASHKHVAVQFFWHLWKVLSQRIRQSNDLLKSFFVHSDERKERAVNQGAVARHIVSDMDRKVAVLLEQGLSSKELQLLAAFSKEELYDAEETIFLEGDAGDTLYIVLDGKVRISKFIPGGGEEALAIFERGDFFGEMALIDGSPRSADAVAHTQTTILPIERRLLTDVLARDVECSYEFLHILCKMLSRRLREINHKIYSWRMMSGGF